LTEHTPGPSSKQDEVLRSVPISPIKNRAKNVVPSRFAKSIFITDLMKAGKFIKSKDPVELHLEHFSIDTQTWESNGQMKFKIEEEKFAEGGFREAFKAISFVNGDHKTWVIKQYKEDAIDGITKSFEANNTTICKKTSPNACCCS